MDNVLVVVEDIEAAKAFFTELGLELEGETTVEGSWVDQAIGSLRRPRRHCDAAGPRRSEPHRIDPVSPAGGGRAEPPDAPANALGIRRIMFAVENIDDVIARLRDRHGAELLDDIAQYEDLYRLCYIRGPEGIIIGLAEQLS